MPRVHRPGQRLYPPPPTGAERPEVRATSCDEHITAPSRCWSRARSAARSSSTPTAATITKPAPKCSKTSSARKGRGGNLGALGHHRVRELREAQQEGLRPRLSAWVQQIEDYAKLGDTVASHLAVKIPDKQQILETMSGVAERLEKVLGLMESEIVCTRSKSVSTGA